MNPLELHIAGATVTHTSPFATLDVPDDRNLLPTDLRESWVIPLCFGIRKPEASKVIVQRRHLINDELISALLANFNWRPRTVAAYLAAVSNSDSFTTQIGRLLLRSDVCYAGGAYCVALASFNSAEAISFLDKYLDYYLKRTELWFDQAEAMAALAFLDRINRTSTAARHMDAWVNFVKDKTNWNLESSLVRFEETMATVNEIKTLER